MVLNSDFIQSRSQTHCVYVTLQLSSTSFLSTRSYVNTSSIMLLDEIVLH